VRPGTHTAILQLRDHVTGGGSKLLNAQINVICAPGGSAVPPIT